MRRATPLLVLLSVLGGASGGMAAGGTGRVALAVGWGALVAAIALARTLRRVAVIGALVGFGALAWASGVRAVHGLEHPPFAPAVVAREPGVLRGAVVGDPRVTPWRVAVIVRAATWAGERGPPGRAGDRSVLVVAARSESSRLRALEAGDRVAVRGRLDHLTLWPRIVCRSVEVEAGGTRWRLPAEEAK